MSGQLPRGPKFNSYSSQTPKPAGWGWGGSAINAKAWRGGQGVLWAGFVLLGLVLAVVDMILSVVPPAAMSATPAPPTTTHNPDPAPARVCITRPMLHAPMFVVQHP